MPVNAGPGRSAGVSPASDVRASETPALRPCGFLVAHPRYAAWLAKCGVLTATDALAIPGEVVCGHPDRHVVRVELGDRRRVVFLKREHVVGWKTRLKNALAGFGWVSRAEREAECLKQLESLGLPGPQWLAYGRDETGRAFLLVDGLTGHTELRELLGDGRLSSDDRRELAERIGRVVADLHDAGFETPDLSAKHVLIQTDSLRPTVIDWQSARTRVVASFSSRVRSFAGLSATVAETLVTPRERLRLLWAYHRSVRWPGAVPRFGTFVRKVQAEAEAIANRSSIREQRTPPGPSQRLVWLAEEAVCARPEIVDSWPTPAAGPPFYPADDAGPARVTLPGQAPMKLVRFRSTARPAWLDRLLGRPWRSPAAKLARVFFHLERKGVPCPRLLAFGQQRTGPTRGDSFVLFTASHAFGLKVFLTATDRESRRRVLFSLGAALRALHDADCQFDRYTRAANRVHVRHDGDVLLDPTAGVRKVRSVALSARNRDLRVLLDPEVAIRSRPDQMRVLAGYFAGDGRAALRAAARNLLGGRPAR